MVKAGIVGGTGYTGVELLRLLAGHPEVELSVITSRSEAGTAVADMFPSLRGHVDLVFSEPDAKTLAACDVVFFATPNGVAMQSVPELLQAGVKIIDLAADFRLKDPAVWKQWYGMDHACTEVLAEAVYGLPELNREAIKAARLVANPGCYPTAVQLGLLPLLEAGVVSTGQIIADCKSGVSGAGRGANVGTLLCEAGESFKAYGVAGHRHWPEIRQGLAAVSGAEVGLTFVPHLTPMARGIHATLYATLKADSTTLKADYTTLKADSTTPKAGDVDLQALFEQRYANEPFVDVLPAGSHPETRSVRGANMCRIAVHRPQDADTLVILSVIDNLVKGAAGQAVQNLNLMFGLAETAGLEAVALAP